MNIVKIERDTETRESSGMVLGKIGDARRAFVADEDDAAILEVDLASGTVASNPIAARPRDLVLLADGRIAATLPDEGAVATFARDDKGALHETARVRPASEPTAMALDPSDATLWVTAAASHSLIALDAATLATRSRVDVGREPRAVMVTTDGTRAIVTHASETFATIVPTSGGPSVTVDLGNRSLCRGGGECSGRRLARNAQTIVRIGGDVVVPVVETLPVPPQGFTKRAVCAPRTGPNAVDLSVKGYGIGNTDAGPPMFTDLARIDVKTYAFSKSSMPALSGPSCLQPRSSVALGEDVLVACRGSSRLVRYTRKPKHAEDDWYYGDGLRADLTTATIDVAAGPTALAVEKDGAHVVVWSSLARMVSRVENGTVVKTIAAPRLVPREEAWLRGRELFLTNGDKRIAADGRTCANCHIDGRDDGLAWKTPLGMRRTRMLAGQTHAPPFGWTGEHANLEDHIKTTLKNLQGTGLPDEDLGRLSTYVSSLRKPAPAIAAGELDADAIRGHDVFIAAECNNCHADGASDRIVHDIGTGGAFLTPTLSGVGTRSRLMHDGRHRTLDDLIVASSGMGRGATLSVDDRRALVHYLGTL